MITKKAHYISGLIVTSFIGIHLFNHSLSILGPERHIEMMNTLRLLYRNIYVEFILLSAIIFQIISGIALFKKTLKIKLSLLEKLHNWTGIYLACFFIIHLIAILSGRLLLNLDTNFYFGATGINSFPLNLFFIPYYGLAIFSFFGHVASIHRKRMKFTFLGFTPKGQSVLILLIGFFLIFLIFYGLTGHFKGVKIPNEYKMLIGK